jgi:hypothetical protein
VLERSGAVRSVSRLRAAAPIFCAAAALALVAPAAGAAERCAEPGTPLYGVSRIDGERVLAQLERRTLRPRGGFQIRLPRGVPGWTFAFSPGCDAVALGALRGGQILLADLQGGRRLGTVSIGGRSAAGTIAWPRPDRLIALASAFRGSRLVTLSVPDGRLVATHHVSGQPMASEPTALGMVVVATPRRRIGPATLALATPDGGILRTTLTRIRGGFEWASRRHLLGRQLVPGLAVDEGSGRAYVVAANEPLVAEVDLLSGAVAYHELSGEGAGSATASKGLAHGSFRTAKWAGDGTIAVSGDEIRTRRNWRRALRRGEMPTRIDPYGLRLIHTADWTVDTLHPSLRWFLQAGDALTGADAIPLSAERTRATGLVGYGVDGRRRFVRFPGNERIGLWGAAWPYAYATFRRPRKRTYVIDLRSGRTANVLPTVRLPVILSPR